MNTSRKRYRAFISYSQRDKAIAQRVHRALETYRVPKGIEAPVGADRRLGRFFRDEDEMGASESLGAALEGALDDSEGLVVICSPSASRSKWVDAEVRRFKSSGDARVFAVIAAGEPNAADPDNECFPPSLKVKIDATGKPTGEPDEPRAPDLRKQGMPRVRAQLAAGLLGIPFDDLWQRDRRRARRRALLVGSAALLVVGVLSVVGLGWLDAQREARIQAARQAVVAARTAASEGRIGESLTRLAPFVERADTLELVEAPLRALLGWVPEFDSMLAPSAIQAVRLRDVTALLDRARGVYDISDVGLELGRLIRSRDGRRLVAIGDQRVVVFDTDTGQRVSQIENEEVAWIGHAFEAPSGLIVVTGAILGPTNGSVFPFVLTVSADGKTARRQQIPGPMFWGSAVGVTAKCDALLLALEGDTRQWRVRSRGLEAAGLGDAQEMTPFRATSDSDTDGVAGLARSGVALQTAQAFLGEVERNPFIEAGCAALAMDDGFAPGTLGLRGAQITTLDLKLSFESADRWRAVTPAAVTRPAAATYLPACTEAKPCSILNGPRGQTYVRDDLPRTAGDRVGSPPAPRWARASEADPEPIYFEHLEFNAGKVLTLCRPGEPGDMCSQVSARGEDHRGLGYLRSPDGRYLFWPFAGTVVDLDTLQPLTEVRAIPEPPGPYFDFDVDRPALTVVYDGRLVSFAPNAAGDAWERGDDARASAQFGLLMAEEGTVDLHTLASLGARHYLAVRNDGVLARLDAATGEVVWRLNAAGLGGVREVRLNPERRHVLVMGNRAWRLFRLADGLALSALLAPPPAMKRASDRPVCELDAALGAAGEVVAICDAQAFAWRPMEYTGELVPRLARTICAADVGASALETIRRCYVGQ